MDDNDKAYIEGFLSDMGAPIQLPKKGGESLRTCNARYGDILVAQGMLMGDAQGGALYQLRKQFDYELEKQALTVGEAILKHRVGKESTLN